MKPVNIGGHAAYQNLVLEQLRKYYPNASSSLDAATWEIMEEFWSLDLSPVDDMMQDRYSVYGPEPRLPSNMLRSYLLSIKCKVTSITNWASDLKQNHLHAILSGFTVGDTPGTGTFYDFFDRLWLSDNNNISDAVHPPKEKPKKPAKKGEKLHLSKRSPSMTFWLSLRLNLPRTLPRLPVCLRFLNPSSSILPSVRGLSFRTTSLSPVTELLSIPVLQNVRPAPANVWKRASVTVNAHAFTTSLTATSGGIPTMNAITLVMTSICSRHLTPKTICRYSLFWVRLPDMIPMVSGIIGSL